MGKTATLSRGNDAKILTCTCESPFQDKRYGASKRVHNWAEKKRLFRCTVCKSERA